MFNINELIIILTLETGWQQLKESDKATIQNPYFTFSGR
jgi:hypothetical protein